MTYLQLADALVKVSLGLALITAACSALTLLLRDARLVTMARRATLLGGFTIVGAAAGLVAGFLRDAFQVEYIFGYSEQKLSIPFKLAGLWAGLDGSLLFWAMILGFLGTWLAADFRKEQGQAASRQQEPYVYLVLSAVQLFFLALLTVKANPFQTLDPHILQGLESQGLASGGRPADGTGLNPILENYWMLIHPPSVYLGFILYTVPFAFAMAALLSGEMSPYWIRKTRRWTLAAWLFNTNGVILGGLWAYEVLGWGGFWAWDPVENASFLPWLAGTAFLHSIMIQERRDMLRIWNVFLVVITFLLSVFGTYLTRSGIVSSVHAFTSSGIGHWFLAFILLVVGVSLFLLTYRRRDLASRNTIDSLLSREAVFLLNNMVLLAITGAVVVLTLWPKISHDFFHRGMTVGPPVYNWVCTPFFALLLLLTAVGPSTGWVRTSKRTLLRNLLAPGLVSIPLAVGTQYLAYVVIRGGDQTSPVTLLQHFYPTFVLTWLSWFIITTHIWEVIRTAGGMVARGKRGWGGALLQLVARNRRRYGGYITHIGLAILAIGVTVTSMYTDQRTVRINVGAPSGSTAQVGPFEVTVVGIQEDEPVSAYLSTRVEVEVKRKGRLFHRVAPEKRFYPETPFRRQPQQTTEVAIARSPWEDFYIYFDSVAGSAGGRVLLFTIFHKPLISLVWTGWIVMLIGGLVAVIPPRRKRVGLAG